TWDGLHIVKQVLATATIKVLDFPALDLTTPEGRAFLAMFSAMAERERLRIVARTPPRPYPKNLPGATGHPQFADMPCCRSEIVRGVPTGAIADGNSAYTGCLNATGYGRCPRAGLWQLVDECEISSGRTKMRGLRVPGTSARGGQPFHHP